MYKKYNKAMEGIYGKEAPEVKSTLVEAKPISKKKPKPLVPTEKQDGQRLVRWFDHKYPFLSQLFIHIANERICTPFHGADFKRSGVKAGTPDYLLAIPRSSYGGLWIELKRRHGGVVSFNQMEMLERLRKQGYAAHVAYGFDEAVKIITEYLAL